MMLESALFTCEQHAENYKALTDSGTANIKQIRFTLMALLTTFIDCYNDFICISLSITLEAHKMTFAVKCKV